MLDSYKDSWFDATPTSPPPQRVEEKATVQEDESSEPHSTESEDDDEEDIPDLDLWKIEGKGDPLLVCFVCCVQLTSLCCRCAFHTWCNSNRLHIDVSRTWKHRHRRRAVSP